jgi:hypothetical protein
MIDESSQQKDIMSPTMKARLKATLNCTLQQEQVLMNMKNMENLKRERVQRAISEKGERHDASIASSMEDMHE